jgi:hypothetical protein
LLKQSLEQVVLSSRVTPLTLSGPYCDLGRFTDAVHGHRKGSQMGFTFAFPMEALHNIPQDSPIIKFDIPETRMPPYPLYYFYAPRESHGLQKTGKVELKLCFAVDDPFGPSLSRMEFNVPGIGSANFVRTIKGKRRQHWRTYMTHLPRQSVRLGHHPAMFLPYLHIREASYKKAGPHIKRRITQFLSANRLCLDYVRRLLTRSSLIGPFRTPPERRYAFAGFSSIRGGASGERTIDLLITEDLLKTPGHPLREAVSFWLKYLKLAKSISVHDIAKGYLFEIGLAGLGQKSDANVADVGYGVSQILPVIVEGLLMWPGGIYMVEEPEIHLHPDAQAGLADFFLYLSSKGVRCVVETHSEYFLIRLRRRLAEGRLRFGGGLPGEPDRTIPLSIGDVAVLLVSLEGNAGAKVRELAIGDAFQFRNLPEGFMGQAVEDRVALLKAVGKGS